MRTPGFRASVPEADFICQIFHGKVLPLALHNQLRGEHQYHHPRKAVTPAFQKLGSVRFTAGRWTTTVVIQRSISSEVPSNSRSDVVKYYREMIVRAANRRCL
jgi:hypothetical protein